MGERAVRAGASGAASGGDRGRPLVLEAAIFDLDGTLVDSAGDILHLLGASLAAEGVPAAPGALNPRLLGPPLEEIVRAVAPGLESAVRERVARRYRTAYRECAFSRSPLYPHAREQLETLRRAGVRLFVATYKPRDVSERLLRHHGILELFEGTAHGDSGPHGRLRKEDMLRLLARRHGLDPTATLMQGDGPGDLAGARACGMHGAAALYGYGEPGALLAEAPEVCLRSMDWASGSVCADGSPFCWKSARDAR